MRISDWSSDVCSSDLRRSIDAGADFLVTPGTPSALADALAQAPIPVVPGGATPTEFLALMARGFRVCKLFPANAVGGLAMLKGLAGPLADLTLCPRSEEHTSELQSLMRISYAVFCLKKKNK